MPDIATLGLAIDSRQVTGAAKELDKLTAAGKKAEDQAQLLEKAAAKGGVANAGYTKALQKAYGVTEEFTDAQVKVIRTLEDLIARTQLSGEELYAYNALRQSSTAADSQAALVIGGLSKAYRDLEKSQQIAAASAKQSGQNFTSSFNASLGIGGAPATSKGATFSALQEQSQKLNMIDEARAKHLAEVTQRQLGYSFGIDRTVKSAKESAAAFLELDPALQRAEKTTRNFAETLTRRFVIGYAVSQIRTLGRALISLAADAARVGDLGRLTGLGSGGVQGVTSAAGFKGIGGDAFSGALVAFNQQIPTAKEGIGSLGALLRANRVTVTDTADAFFKVADLVKNAASDTARLSILQQAGLPATMEMARFMGQGAAAIREAAAGTSKLTDAQVEAARKIEDRWNELWTNFKTGGKAAMVEVADGWIAAWQRPFMDPSTLLGGWLEKAKALAGGVPEIAPSGIGSDPDRNMTTFMSGRKGPVTVDAATQKTIAQDRISKAQQYLGLLGATTTALEARRAVELQIAAAGINGVGIDKSRADTLKRLAEEQNLGITAMKQGADAARVEAETVGMSVGKAQEYVTVQTALNEARRNGKALTDGNIEAIRREAAALGEAAQHADTMRWSYTNLVQGPLQTFRSELSRGASAWDALKSAGASALNAISTKLMDMAAQNLWQAAFPGGGGGGFLASIFGGGSSGGTFGGTGGGLGGLFAKGGVPSASSDISRFSNQIVTKPTFFTKGGNVMGEAGPEAVMPLVRTPDGNLGVRSQGGNSAPAINVNIYQTNDFRGVEPGMRADLERKIAKSKQEAVTESVQAVSKVHGNSPGNYLPRGR